MCARRLVFEQLVIKPTLAYLGIRSAATRRLLVASFIDQPAPAAKACRPHLYAIKPEQHRNLWDRHLAFEPELASKVRSLASRENFLRDPDQELYDNPAYATAIACLLLQINPRVFNTCNVVPMPPTYTPSDARPAAIAAQR